MKKRIRKIIYRMFLTTIATASVLAITASIYTRHPKFGENPTGERLERIKKSPNYRNGQFQNLSHTPSLAEGYSYPGVLWNYFFNKEKRLRPVDSLPSVKTDLLALKPEENVLVWMGHSSYYMQVDGKRFLVDPVLSGSASPLGGGVKAFRGADIYTVDDLPPIDYLLLSHDHYDHADFQTLVKLQPRVSAIICGLGVGSHLELWGYTPGQITEMDWQDSIALPNGFQLHALPGRHFSGRTLKRNKTLWVSFMLETPFRKIFVGGDSGYDTHFAEIGKRFGSVDLAILENGQYNEAWRYIHMLPDEVWKAAKDLKAKRLLPVHSAKFTLGNHAWDEPLETVYTNAEADSTGPILATPMIGQILNLDAPDQMFEPWWRTVQ